MMTTKERCKKAENIQTIAIGLQTRLIYRPVGLHHVLRILNVELFLDGYPQPFELLSLRGNGKPARAEWPIGYFNSVYRREVKHRI